MDNTKFRPGKRDAHTARRGRKVVAALQRLRKLALARFVMLVNIIYMKVILIVPIVLVVDT